MPENRNYWFAAKRFGIGWAFPAGWHGWVATASYLVFLAAGMVWLPQGTASWVFMAMLTAAFAAVVVWKGEKPIKWRWRGY